MLNFSNIMVRSLFGCLALLAPAMAVWKKIPLKEFL